MTNSLLFSNISHVSNLIKNQELSSIDLTRLTIDQIKKYNFKINTFITVAEDDAINQAKRADEEILKGNWRGPLHGVPIAIKDIIQTRGLRTTAGSKIFKDWIPNEDATVIKRLKKAGAIIIGKANLHEFAMGATSENPHFGNVKNPWDLNRIPGGSSGGSAVATATGMAFGAIGTDTAGSIRLPAAFCGTVGFKPTYNLVNKKGCFPFSWSLDHIGPMTRTVKDAAILLSAIIEDNTNKSVLFHESFKNLKGIKLGFPEEYMFSGINPSVKSVIKKAFEELRELGAEIVPIELKGINQALDALKTIAQSEAMAYHEPLLDKFPNSYGEDLKYRFQFGNNVSATDYINAHRTRNRFIKATMEQMENIDALIGPTNVQEPYEIGTTTPKKAISNMFDLGKTPLANILGFPSVSVPCGFTPRQLPVGLQLIGKIYNDKKILQIGECYENFGRWTEQLITNNAYNS